MKLERGMVKQKGPSVGTFKNADIPAYIETDRGWFTFDRTADTAEGFDMSHLRRNEVIIAPGLTYKAANVATLPVVRVERYDA